MSHSRHRQAPCKKTRTEDTPRVATHVAHPTYSAFCLKIGGFRTKPNTQDCVRCTRLGFPPACSLLSAFRRGNVGRLFCPTGMSKNTVPLSENSNIIPQPPLRNQRRFSPFCPLSSATYVASPEPVLPKADTHPQMILWFRPAETEVAAWTPTSRPCATRHKKCMHFQTKVHALLNESACTFPRACKESSISTPWRRRGRRHLRW